MAASPAEPATAVYMGANMTQVICPDCQQDRKPFSRVFYGERVDPKSGLPESVSHLLLPNFSMTEAELAANSKSTRAFQRHYCLAHPDVSWKPDSTPFVKPEVDAATAPTQPPPPLPTQPPATAPEACGVEPLAPLLPLPPLSALPPPEPQATVPSAPRPPSSDPPPPPRPPQEQKPPAPQIAQQEPGQQHQWQHFPANTGPHPWGPQQYMGGWDGMYPPYAPYWCNPYGLGPYGPAFMQPMPPMWPQPCPPGPQMPHVQGPPPPPHTHMPPAACGAMPLSPGPRGPPRPPTVPYPSSGAGLAPGVADVRGTDGTPRPPPCPPPNPQQPKPPCVPPPQPPAQPALPQTRQPTTNPPRQPPQHGLPPARANNTAVPPAQPIQRTRSEVLGLQPVHVQPPTVPHASGETSGQSAATTPQGPAQAARVAPALPQQPAPYAQGDTSATVTDAPAPEPEPLVAASDQNSMVDYRTAEDLGNNATCISCPVCARLGRSFSRTFVGRRIDPVTGAVMPLTYLQLPNDDESMSDADCAKNAKSMKAYKDHFRRHHSGILYEPDYAGYTEHGKPAARARTNNPSNIPSPLPPGQINTHKPKLLYAGPIPTARLVLPSAQTAATNPIPAVASQLISAGLEATRALGRLGTVTMVHCPFCVKAGKTPYCKPFIGRRVDPLTGKEVPLDYLHLPNVGDEMSEEAAEVNGNSLACMNSHFRRMHPRVMYLPDYGGFTRLGKKRTTEMVNAGPPPQAHVAAEPFPPSQPSPDTFSGGAQQASEPGASCLGAGAYLSEALVQAEDQLRGLDLHPVHPPVGSGMRTHKAQLLGQMLTWLGIRDINISEPWSAWLWDTDEWEPAWMSEDTLKRVSYDAVPSVHLDAHDDALIGREWRALQSAWCAAERRYASVLEELQQGRQVPDMNGCYEIQNLRMFVKSLNAYVTVCGGESGSPGTDTASWQGMWEDRVWEVATELAEDMYERRVDHKRPRLTPEAPASPHIASPTMPASTPGRKRRATTPRTPAVTPSPAAESDPGHPQSDIGSGSDQADSDYRAQVKEWQSELQQGGAGLTPVVSAAERVKMRKRQKSQAAGVFGRYGVESPRV